MQLWTTINSGRTMFSTVRSCSYEKQLCRGSGEPACCFVLSVLSVLIFFFFCFILLCQFCFVCFFCLLVLPVASPPGRVHDSDPMGGHDSDPPVGPGYNIQLPVSQFCYHRACISRIRANTGCAGCVCVLHIKPFFYPSTSSTPSVRADSCSQRDASSVVTKPRHRDTKC